LCGFFAFIPIHFKKTARLPSFIKFNWLFLLKIHFYAKKGIFKVIIIANFYQLSIFLAFLYKKFHFYYEFNKKLVILDMQMQKTSSYLMPIALVSVSNTGKTALYVYDAGLSTNHYFIFLKYYYLKSILIKRAGFIRQLLFPDHGFG
jgi:hypothetical protein